MAASPILAVRHLNVWYGNQQVLGDVTLDFAPHHITALIGASGSGKSTFLRSVNRMLDTIHNARIDGEIVFRQHNILQKDTDVIALRRSIGMVFQNPTPFPKSIFDNIAYGLEIQGMERPRRPWFGSSRLSSTELERSHHPMDIAVLRSLREAALWEEVKDRLHHSAFRLSGGQQQRLCIARALAVQPSVLLLDEPCSELDPISTHHIEQTLLRLRDHLTIVIVTHNLHQARRIADTTCFFHAGALLEHGPTQTLFTSPQESLTRDYVHGRFG
ncbi:phosphate ABC transporter ATP-binding protein [Candidatus Peribacteria bacterium RIFCSPLOWO2_12_FULL_55_15]|nr:MAG: phosphate ABC transporter ATP-binding protein [Candidatus Peribacteria bacterium RIFCSPHIGHO2_01_FULL_54_22]OGJ62482.1 MAG: phosphate ABC transporter ATP-binding protein [Candidatus Peribacteria bacterium RIFCSPHIGHO2_02_FULL_55_24]OGJ67531.1 MAG: phosphate ABC transporter ATP-binding protein [Candidatus Peribacteria bacterium RIFCSPLOWO2_01_FULL_54_110]OGJ69286.1 MAG: phosphate ABC transporter ATP-binding protein [Candidatus Peribacteria bacterium RIFCSPLOWO2_02_FULL_55_36]OGJ71788.1 M